MSLLDTATQTVVIAGTILGTSFQYLRARGEIEVWHRERNLPKLMKKRDFLQTLHASGEYQMKYLCEAILTAMMIF